MACIRTPITSYTKHYYIGSQRVSSALGTTFRLGFFPNQANNFFADLTSMEDFRDVANAKVHTATAALSATYSAMNQSVALPNPVVESNLNSFAFAPNLYDAYFYHSDHLGSSNYISNNTGIVSQHTEYLPFGETFVDEHLNSHNTPFKFNAKEFDDETGNYYYGARYYNPKWNVWLSVDPLVEKTMDAYGYCYQNPTKYIDPNGKDPIDYINQDGKKIGTDGVDDGVRILVSDPTDVVNIENATKNNEVFSVESLTNPTSAKVLPDDDVLNEALHVLKRGDKNGGLREESSIVGYSGRVYRGKTGPYPNIDGNNFATADAELPYVLLLGINDSGLKIGESGGVSIHLHPIKPLMKGTSIYPFSCSFPTAGVDDKTWKSLGFRLNIIVGKIGELKNPTMVNGNIIDTRTDGASFYESGSLSPSYELTESAIKNIINKK